MTSKNSFLARLIENAKRRTWLLVVSLLVFVLAIPIYAAMEISIISQREDLIQSLKVKEALYNFADAMYSGSNGVIFTLVGLFAVISAIQGFSYLYDKNKIDFYNSKPVKATTRFFSIWTNGILVWLIPYIVGTLLNLVLFAANGILDVNLFGSAWLYMVLALGLYLCIYHLAILALMMTGKVGVTCLGILVFLLYEACVKVLMAGYFSHFYRFFYAGDDSRLFIPALSPITFLSYYASEEWSAPVTLFFLLLFATVVLAIAFWCYKKRPTELAGSAMTFSAVKPIIKIGIAVPVALCGGLLTSEIVSYSPIDGKGNPGFPILIGILGLVIICCLIQVIYESDIKGIFHKKIDIVISFVLAMCIALIFRFDLTGFDTRLPDAEDIEYVTIITEAGSRYGKTYLDEGMTWVNKEEYVNKYMRLTGETAETARNLAERSIELFLEQPDREAFYDTYEESSYVIFNFHKKNGSVISREIPVAIREEEIVPYIEKIESSEEFILANENALSEELMKVLNGNEWKVEASWGNGIFSEELSRKQVRELLELYRLDIKNDNYRIRSSELPIGEVEIYIYQTFYSRGDKILIYPSFTNCVKYLETNGFETKEYIPVEDIEKITVTRYYDNEAEEDAYYYDSYGNYGYVESANVSEISQKLKSYTETAEINEIINHSYPVCMEWEYWYAEYPLDEDYRIHVYFKEDSPCYSEYGYDAEFYFLKDQIPAFIKTDLPDKPVKTE